MCGIVGIVSDKPVVPGLMEGLRRLEYRGYDSAGIATVMDTGFRICRASGKLVNLQHKLDDYALDGTVGIGHTRWATHGQPSERNAHPHANRAVAIVHNGIVENFASLRAELQSSGWRFESDTDTEVIAHLLADYLANGHSIQSAVSAALKRLEGSFALGIIFSGQQDLLVAARRGSPLAIGYGNNEMFVGSDAIALAHLTSHISYLEDGDWAVLSKDNAQLFDSQGKLVTRSIVECNPGNMSLDKGTHKHFMHKEIHEQPLVIDNTLRLYLNPESLELTLPRTSVELGALERVTISGCGTALHAGLVARYWLESIAQVPVDIDIASEFRYREPPLTPGGLALFISQSGETIDTLAALRYAKGQAQHTLAVVNRPESAIAREASIVFPTLAGPEIGVASTKAFTTQLAVLACLTLAVAEARGLLGARERAGHVRDLLKLPDLAGTFLQSEAAVIELAKEIAKSRDVLYLGRGAMFPLALEGALKLKEVSYLQANGYAAGEMKHGPIALVSDGLPIIVCAPSGPLFEKTMGNISEAKARGAHIVLFTDTLGAAAAKAQADTIIAFPAVPHLLAPALYALPLQLLAYHVGLLKGTDVDQPRNLAKSVTVE